MADDLARDASLADIEEHIAFLIVCIDSLDEHTVDRHSKLRDLESQKREAERRRQDFLLLESPSKPPAMSSQATTFHTPSTKRHERSSFDQPDRPFKRPTSSNHPVSMGLSNSLIERVRSRQLLAEKRHEEHRQLRASDEQFAKLCFENANFPLPSATLPSTQQTRLESSRFLKTPSPPALEPEPSPGTGSSQSHYVQQGSDVASSPQFSRPHMARTSPIESMPYGRNATSSNPRQPDEVIDLTESDNEAAVSARHRSTPMPPSETKFSHFVPKTSFSPSARALPNTQLGRFSPGLHATSRHPMPGAFPGSDLVTSPNATTINMSPGHVRLTDSLPNTNPTPSPTRLPMMHPPQRLDSRGASLAPSRSTRWTDAIRWPFYRPDVLIDESGSHSRDHEVFRNSPSNQSASYGPANLNEPTNHDPAKTQEEINALLSNIRPDEDMPAHQRVQQPPSLTVKLHRYQEIGLSWLEKSEESSNRGGILADDMGLGKTVQMIALMVKRRSNDPSRRTTLIVAPVSLLHQWKQEIEQKIKPGYHRLSVFIHHGSSKKKRFSDLQGHDVIITSYGSLATELKKMQRLWLRRKRENNPSCQPSPHETCVLIGEGCKWYRCILDESQFIKNDSTMTAKGAYLIDATYRYCVTGTPMMNSVSELYSLVHFLRIPPFCDRNKFRTTFRALLISQSSEQNRQAAMRQLQALCKAIMLRRTKSSQLDGKPILILSPKITTVDYPVFDDAQRDFYNAIESQQRLQFNRYLEAGTVGSSYASILVMLLRLRQTCCHPHLVRDFSIAAAADITPEAMLGLAKELAPEVVKRIRAEQGSFECSICWDAAPNPAIFIPCGHRTCDDCFAKLTDPATAVMHGTDGHSTKAKCPECRGEIDTKHVIDFDAFRHVHQPELLSDDERAGLQNKGSSRADESDDDTDDESQNSDDSDEDDDDDMDGFIVPDEETIDDDGITSNSEEEKDRCKSENDNSRLGIGSSAKLSKGKAKSWNRAKGKSKGKGKDKGKRKRKKGKEKSKEMFKTLTIPELKKQARGSAAHRREYFRRLRERWESSAKLDKMMEILNAIMSNGQGEKILVFSQWTSLLDLVEVPIDKEGWRFCRYDGSMSANQRAQAVDDFKDDGKNLRIMLVSLKAGNAGLNLNVASQVIILDPFWNPYIEDQAVDRAHRLGQMRPVHVHRLLIQETVEDRIVALQERKRLLISQALDEQAGQSLARLGVNELAYLFGVTSSVNSRVNYTARDGRR